MTQRWQGTEAFRDAVRGGLAAVSVGRRWNMPAQFSNSALLRALGACALLMVFSSSSVLLAEEPYDGMPVGYVTDDETYTDDAGASDEVNLLDDRPAITIDGKPYGTTKRRGSCSSPPDQAGTGQDANGELTQERSGAGGGGTVAIAFDPAAAVGPGAGGTGAYLDLPFIVNQYRLRYDDVYDDNAPDRAEYFYAKCGCFRTAQGNLHDPNAKGPTDRTGNLAASFVNYQAIRNYLELKVAQRLSIFAEIPVQFDNIHFATNANGLPSAPLKTGGLADMNAGFKFAFLARRDRYLTFQLRTYIPTGDSQLGLGTHHVSLEPALLYWQALSSRAFIQGQLNDWIPIGGSDFQGNVLSYGGGFGYVVYRQWDPTARGAGASASNLPGIIAAPNLFQIAPVAEVVGWSVLSGQEYLNGTQLRTAVGTSIVNLKFGVRFTKGANSLYAGWGHGITSDIWYRNIFRLEYRRFF
jgi:hypothetical protein